MSGAVRILPSGPHAFLAEYQSLDDVLGVMARVRTAPPDGVVDIVPAARTILVTVRDGVDPQVVTDAFIDTASSAVVAESSPSVTIEVAYDGVDLNDVAAACSLSVADVIALHSATEYTVAFCGFVPGFSYLLGLDPRLHLPRRATPRTRVPAGSVAIASEFTAVYPSDGPGGWHLLGTTDAVMWDDDRPVAALLPPGARVRFVPR
jgi:KipI family sensor histidine kinase inhibitor